MKALGRLLVEVVVLCAIGTGVGLTVNSIRADNRLDIDRNYFAKPTIKKPPAPHLSQVGASAAIPPSAVASTPPVAGPAAASTAPVPDPVEELGVTMLGFEEVRRLFENPPEPGGVLFIDARNEEQFADGHVPGAVLLNHYKLDQYLLKVLPLAQSTETIVVYCHGGDCEDSLFACQDLIEAGIPCEALHVYKGGWEEWERRQMPSEREFP